MSVQEQTKSLAIGIPTINQYWDGLDRYLVDYTSRYFKGIEIFLADNGKQNILINGQAVQYMDFKETKVRLIINDPPKRVAASWNALCQLIFIKHQYALILNDDIMLERPFEVINTFLNTFKADFYTSQKGFCSFVLPKATYQRIGPFDENFKGAYFEDRDYERRLKMARMDTVKSVVLNPTLFKESASIRKDPKLNENYQANADYYRKKWGGNLGGEVYITPFNK